MRRLVGLALLVLSGCLLDFPEEADGPFPCRDDDDCVAGYICIADLCASAARDDGGARPDSSQPADATLPEDASDAGPEADAEAPPDATPEDVGPIDAGCDQTWCGDECVDTNTNPRHCGACNFDCGGTQCTFGDCAPFEVHGQAGAKPNRLVHAEGTVYWADQRLSGAVMGRIADGTAPAFVVASGVRYPTGLAVSGTWVAWSALDELSGARNGAVQYREAPFTGAVLDAATDQSNPAGVAMQANVVSWNSNSPPFIRAHLLGRDPNSNLELSASMGSSFLRLVITSATEVIWADAQADIWAHPLDLQSTAPVRRVVDSTDGEASAMILHDGTLYWAESIDALAGSGRIFSAAVATGQVRTLVTQADPTDADRAAAGLAFASGYLYYTTTGRGGRGGGVYRVPHTGGPPELLVAGDANDTFRGIATGSGRYFWAQNEAVYSKPLF